MRVDVSHKAKVTPMAVIVGDDVVAYDHAVKGILDACHPEFLAVCYVSLVVS